MFYKNAFMAGIMIIQNYGSFKKKDTTVTNGPNLVAL